MFLKKLLLETTDLLRPTKQSEAKRRIELIPFNEDGECTRQQLEIVLEGLLEPRELLAFLTNYHEGLMEIVQEEFKPLDLLISTLLPNDPEDEESDMLVDYLLALSPDPQQLVIVKQLIPEWATAAERLQICRVFFSPES